MTQQLINEFIVYITFKCNFSCKMCTQNTVPKLQEMSVEDWDKIFKEIETYYPNSTIIFLGGEPTTYKDFDKLLEKVSCHKLHKHIVSNGYNLLEYLPIIKKHHCGVTLSIDGINDTHDKIRNKKGAFKKAENMLKEMHKINIALAKRKFDLYFITNFAILLLKNLRKNFLLTLLHKNLYNIENKLKKFAKAWYKKNNSPGEADKKIPIYYNINFVMLPDNIDEMYDYIDRMLQHKPNEIILNHPRFISLEKDFEMKKVFENLYPNPYSSRLITREDIEFSAEYVKKMNGMLKYIFSKYDRKTVKEFPEFNSEEERIAYYTDEGYNLRKEQRCLSPYKIPFIFPDGTISSCIYNSLGNCKTTEIKAIWESESAVKTREYLDNNGNFPVCSRCTCFYKQ